MYLNKSGSLVAKILGGILFAIQGLIIFLFLNWPFGATESRGYFSFIALALSMSGYLIAIFRSRIGGIIMIAGALLLGAIVFLNSNNGDVQTKLLITLIIAVPVIIVGVLFMIPVNNKTRQEQKL